MKVRTHVLARTAVAVGAIATLVTAPSHVAPTIATDQATMIASAPQRVDDLDLTRQAQQRASRDAFRARLVLARKIQEHRRVVERQRKIAARREALRAIAAARATRQRAAARTGSSTAGVPPVWEALVQCEASGHWDEDTGNGFYGGPQFTLGTYHSYGGVGMPQDQAPAYQVMIARRVLNAQGVGAWPVCGPRVGLRRGD